MHRPEAGKFMQAEFGGLWGEGAIGWAGDLYRPASLGQTLGECQALAIGAASSQAGVKLQNPGDQG
ncbi:MAG: hypothetical protein EBU36_06170 [Verrucomicrobia bacterium]|nr:hypothetical protein [Verrucomicrobiota bacterium]